jgi:pimeloyl-ACP methyl ester carboxylesterase
MGFFNLSGDGLVWLTAILGYYQAFFALPVSSAARLPVSESQELRDRAICTSAHPNPVVILHGLGANKDEDLNLLEAFLQEQGFCTFSLTYGDYPELPLVGGLLPIATSAGQIAEFIRQTLAASGAAKVDIVGHSEGAFQSLYVPKFESVSTLVDKIVSIAPPTHGTTFAGLFDLAYAFGGVSRALVGDLLDLIGCDACNDLGPGGPAVMRLNDGTPILQPGNTLTVIASKSDELVTPTDTAFVNEPGVQNIYVQDYCPSDPVGHIGEAYDLNVWNLVLNALDSTPNRTFTCVIGSPGR